VTCRLDYFHAINEFKTLRQISLAVLKTLSLPSGTANVKILRLLLGQAESSLNTVDWSLIGENDQEKLTMLVVGRFRRT